MPAERMTAGEKEWTASNTSFEGGMAIDATVPFGYESDFMRPVYPVERIDLKKFFNDTDIQMPNLACRLGPFLARTEDRSGPRLHPHEKGQGLSLPFFKPLWLFRIETRGPFLLTEFSILVTSGFLWQDFGRSGARMLSRSNRREVSWREDSVLLRAISRTRKRAPFWFGFNNNKRGITLNLESARGRAPFSACCQSGFRG